MPHPLVRITPQSHRALKLLARQAKQPMHAVLERAIEAERRRRFFVQVNDDYTRLRADPKAWAEYQAELAEWDVTLMDGLDPNERWADPMAATQPKRRRSATKA